MEFNSLATDKNWQKYSLEEICLKITSGGTPSRQNPKLYKNGNINWIKTKELNNGYIFESEEKITEEAIKKSSAKLLPVNTILLAMYGATVGELGILGKEMACNQACCALIIDPKKADYRFIFYLLLLYKKEIQSLATGAAQQNLSAKTIKEFSFYIPNLEKQKKIADILSELDKKIDLNTQINQTLEQIAQALFKSWFVDFDPVRAEVQALSDGLSLEQAEQAAMQAISGKTPEELTALSQTQPDHYAELAETAKAFPCEMVEVDGVEVPKGWDTLSFKDFIKEKKEKVGNLKNVPEYSVTNNGIIPRSQIFNKQLSKNPEKNKLLHKTDLVFGMSREVLNWGIMEDEIGAVSSAYHIYSINKDKVNYLYLKMLMQNRFEYFNELIRPSSREGQGFDKELLKEKKVTIPCNILLDKFLHDLNTIKSQMNNITQETESLIFIRNLLLPKLLNGEI